MKKNMGNADRLIRLILAVVVGVLFYGGVVTGTVATVLLVLAGIFLLTSFVGYCPLYALLGVSTCPKTTGHRH